MLLSELLDDVPEPVTEPTPTDDIVPEPTPAQRSFIARYLGWWGWWQ
jgi:hypothetical protein